MIQSAYMKHQRLLTTSPFFALCLLALLLGACCCPHKFIPKEEPDPLPPFFVPEQIRVALVLGSGGVRGMVHVGVLEELEAAGIPIDLIVGCSAGSIVGALYADNPDAEAIHCAVSSIRADSLLDIDLLNCRYGLSQAKCLNRVLDKYLKSETFEDLKIPLIVVATDLHTGELVPIGSGDLVKAVRSSCSIPFVYVPSEHMGRVLVDGGVIDPVPVRVARDLGAQIIIAVDLCELLEQTFPTNLFQVITRSSEIAFMWQNQRCTHHAHVIIRPKTCGVGTFNDKMKGLLYHEGKRATREQLPKIKEMLAELPIEECGRRRDRFIKLSCYHPQIYQD